MNYIVPSKERFSPIIGWVKPLYLNFTVFKVTKTIMQLVSKSHFVLFELRGRGLFLRSKGMSCQLVLYCQSLKHKNFRVLEAINKK